MSVTQVGLYKIIVPDLPHLMFEDGQRLAVQAISSNMAESIIKNRAKIAILFPDHFIQYTAGIKGPKIYAEFFVGLLEETLEKIRDLEFPELRIQANRGKIREVGDGSVVVTDAVQNVFQTAWITYDPLERFLEGRIFAGIQHKDGSHTLLGSRESDLLPLQDINEGVYRLSVHVANKFCKGLDCMFSSNLRGRDLFLKAAEQSLDDNKLHMRPV